MKVLLDMNLSPRWVSSLSASEIEAVHWSSVGKATATDAEIMRYARDRDFVVMTHDLDFSAMLAANQAEKPSVVQIRADDLSVDAIGMAVIDALLQMRGELELGALVTIDPRRTRLRILPLRKS